MMNAKTALTKALEEPYPLRDEQLDIYRKNGFLKLRNVFSPEVLSYMNQVITAEVGRLNVQELPIESRDTYGKAFLQIMNLWTRSEWIKEIVFSKRLARIATALMDVQGVRLYHDQALFKEPGGGHTPWHADQYYWPVASDKTVTAWLPLQATPLEWGPIEFSAGSNSLTVGRNLKISDESQLVIEQKLRQHGFLHIIEPFDAGEISFHSGWLFHRAGPNLSGQMRKVMTMIYMDKDMILKEPENDNQVLDWATWCPGVKVGQVIDSSLNPVLVQG